MLSSPKDSGPFAVRTANRRTQRVDCPSLAPLGHRWFSRDLLLAIQAFSIPHSATQGPVPSSTYVSRQSSSSQSQSTPPQTSDWPTRVTSSPRNFHGSTVV